MQGVQNRGWHRVSAIQVSAVSITDNEKQTLSECYFWELNGIFKKYKLPLALEYWVCLNFMLQNFGTDDVSVCLCVCVHVFACALSQMNWRVSAAGRHLWNKRTPSRTECNPHDSLSQKHLQSPWASLALLCPHLPSSRHFLRLSLDNRSCSPSSWGRVPCALCTTAQCHRGAWRGHMPGQDVGTPAVCCWSCPSPLPPPGGHGYVSPTL